MLRCEHATFIYRYEPCNVGNIRKMVVLIPEVGPENLAPKEMERFNREANDDCSAIYQLAQKNPDVKFLPCKIRPTKVSVSATDKIDVFRMMKVCWGCYLNKIATLGSFVIIRPSGMQVGIKRSSII